MFQLKDWEEDTICLEQRKSIAKSLMGNLWLELEEAIWLWKILFYNMDNKKQISINYNKQFKIRSVKKPKTIRLEERIAMEIYK